VGPAAGGVAARWVALLSVRVLRADVSSSRLSVCLMLALLMRRPRPAGRRSNHGCDVITTLLIDLYRIDSHCSCAYCFGRLCRVKLGMAAVNTQWGAYLRHDTFKTAQCACV